MQRLIFSKFPIAYQNINKNIMTISKLFKLFSKNIRLQGIDFLPNIFDKIHNFLSIPIYHIDLTYKNIFTKHISFIVIWFVVHWLRTINDIIITQISFLQTV